MKITFLGTSHGYAEKNRYTSSTIIEVGEHSYILDAGAPLEYILVNREKSFDAIRGIFITHMHSDHVGCLNTLIEPFMRFRYNDKAVCFLPEQAGIDGFIAWLGTMHCPEEKVRAITKFCLTTPGMIFENEDVKVTAIPTMHLGGRFPAYAYLFEADGRSVLFTGDMGMKFCDYENVVGTRHYDLVVCEMAHADLCDCKEKLKATNTSRMLINHYHTPRLEGYETIFREFPFDVQLAVDGMEILV